MLVDLTKKESIEKLKNVKNYIEKNLMIRRNPEIILYAAKYWNDKSEDYKKLVYKALVLKPDIVLKFKNKYGLNIEYKTIGLALLSDPMVAQKMPDTMKAMIDRDLFIDAFAKNPLILTVKDLPVLKTRIYATKTIINEDGTEEEKKIVSTLRNECLKAIRLSEKVSRYHPDYDDFAAEIAKKLDSSKDFQNKKYSEELLKNFATLMNVLIKKENQKLRACSAEQWLVNNGKPMYKAVRTAAKKDSKIEGLLADMPTNIIGPKIVKKLVINAVKSNPEEYLKLESYGLGGYMNDVTVKYNVYKSLKKHRMLKEVSRFLDEKDIEKASNKVAGTEKRKQTKSSKPANKKVEEAKEEKYVQLQFDLFGDEE